MAVMQMAMRFDARRHSAMARKTDPTSTAQLSLFAATMAAEVAEATRPAQPAPVAVTPPPPPAPVAPPPAEVPDLLPDFLASRHVKDQSHKHIGHMAQHLRACQRVVGVPLAAMTKRDIKRFDAWLAKRKQDGKIMASTWRKYQAAVRVFFVWAVEDERLAIDPTAGAFAAPKLPKRLPKFLTAAELAQMLDGAALGENPERDRALIALMAMCGCRIAEALGANWEHFADGYLTVVGKNDKERRIPVPAALWPYLDAWRAVHPLDGKGPVFTSGAYHRRLGYTCWRKHLPRIVKRSGVTCRVTSHRLRHTYATLLLTSGLPLDQIQKLLGHSNISTTQLYAATRIGDDTVIGINAAFGVANQS